MDLIKISSAKGTDVECDGKGTFNNVIKFCAKMKSIGYDTSFQKELIFNTDETWVQLTNVGRNLKYVVSSKIPRPSMLEDRNRKHVTLLPIICADGTLLMKVYILPIGKKQLKTREKNKV